MATTDGIQAFADATVPKIASEHDDDKQSDAIRQYLSKKVQ